MFTTIHVLTLLRLLPFIAFESASRTAKSFVSLNVGGCTLGESSAVALWADAAPAAVVLTSPVVSDNPPASATATATLAFRTPRRLKLRFISPP